MARNVKNAMMRRFYMLNEAPACLTRVRDGLGKAKVAGVRQRGSQSLL